MLRQIERRKKYEEFFWYALALEALRSKKQIAIKKSKNIKEDILEEIKLPYELTLDQKNAIKDIIKDLNKDYKMNRLLQGDVGSGKTIVALIAALLVIKEGYQVLFMAPTEALALQHYNTSLGLFKEFRPFFC
ncbi:MAG: DEAD/DEAH box helicase [Clostridium sp.]|nr:MAG: DEAD/DEAH box helicase [Clostridium sp.]